ncbi:hypothetical protein N780_04735 [Pontibacillus chungwhensis BH030062]|uniref:KTSC domain-containing protein n=1 Tax=Pontibacillus chungwhensis BH030062 TaxID=1385513 RepID=A0A0A2UUN7_9BACI|nr:hypothetical protein [Pontibacillus chungwhensis]KGP90453.1 hypothetical protein N780_04735 [Pontibacillus chungwhensis BH030062]
MNVTNFNKKAWNLSHFSKIGYCKEKKRLCIYFLNGFTMEVYDVEESVVFEFIISLEKEAFIRNNLASQYCVSFYASPLRA